MSARPAAWAVGHLAEREAVFGHADLLAATLAREPGAVTVEALERDGNLHAARGLDHGRHWTTDAAMARESETIALMRGGEGAEKTVMRRWVAETKLHRGRLNEGQKEAVKTILASTDRVIGIEGYAGTGKTTMLKRLRALGESHGYTTVGLAPSASAAKTLRNEAGIQSETLQRYLARHDGIAHGRRLGGWEHDRVVRALALSRDRRTALVGAGRAALLIDVEAVEIRHRWRHKAPVTTVATDSHGRWILAGSAGGRAVLGEARTGATAHRWTHRGSGDGGVTSAAFSPDGRRVLVGAANTTAVLRDVGTGGVVHAWRRVGGRVTAVSFGLGGRWALTEDEGYEVELHDTETGRTVRKWRYAASPRALAFSADDRQVLMDFADGAVIVCDLRLPERRRGYVRTHLAPDGGCW